MAYAPLAETMIQNGIGAQIKKRTESG